MKAYATKLSTPSRRTRKTARNTVFAFNKAERKLAHKALRKARHEETV